MSLINLVAMERLPLGKHLELTLKATRSVFARRVLAKHVFARHGLAGTCGLERERKDAAAT